MLWWVSCPLHSYSLKNTPPWRVFHVQHLQPLFPLGPTTTSLTPSYPATCNHHTSHPIQAPRSYGQKNAFTRMRFHCPQAFLSSYGHVSDFRWLPFPFPSCGHMDAFLVSACSLPPEKQKHAPMGVFLLFCRLPSPPPPCQHLKRIHRDVFQVLAGSLLKTRSMAHGAMFLVSAASSACAEQCGVFLVFSPFLGNFLFRYILFRYIYGVIDIIIYLF